MPRSRFASTVFVVSSISVGAVVVRHDLHVGRQHASCSASSVISSTFFSTTCACSPDAHEDDAFDRVVLLHVAELAEPRARDRSPPCRRRGCRPGCRCASRRRCCRCPRASSPGRGRGRSRTGRPANRSRRPRWRCWPPSCCDDLRHGDAVREQPLRIDLHLVLHRRAAEAGVVGDALDGRGTSARGPSPRGSSAPAPSGPGSAARSGRSGRSG